MKNSDLLSHTHTDRMSYCATHRPKANGFRLVLQSDVWRLEKCQQGVTFTICECCVVMFSVLSLALSVCLSVCHVLTVDSLDVDCSFSVRKYIFRISTVASLGGTAPGNTLQGVTPD